MSILTHNYHIVNIFLSYCFDFIFKKFHVSYNNYILNLSYFSWLLFFYLKFFIASNITYIQHLDY